MKTNNLKKLKQKAYEAGENDTYTNDILLEQARLFADEVGYSSNEEFNAIINAYEDGFLGRKLK